MFSMIFLQTSVCWLISLSRLVSLGVRRLAWMKYIDRDGQRQEIIREIIPGGFLSGFR
jgi:hypothetical protein